MKINEFFGEIVVQNIGYTIHVLHVLEFMIATPVLFIAGKQFFVSAYKALKRKRANMDTLIVLGTFTAWLYSSFVTFLPSIFLSLGETQVFFEATVFIVLFILLGRLMESRAKSKAGDSISSLINLVAKTATVIREGGN
jgi:Cu+-exporting ATPase